MADVTMSLEEYERLLLAINNPQSAWFGLGGGMGDPAGAVELTTEAKPKKRKVSAYHKRLGRAIKALRAKHLLKNGKWRKGWSQRKMMKAAHRAAKKG